MVNHGSTTLSHLLYNTFKIFQMEWWWETTEIMWVLYFQTNPFGGWNMGNIRAPVKILYISVVAIFGSGFFLGPFKCIVPLSISGGGYRFTVFRAHLWQKCFCDTTVVFNCKTYYGNKHKHIKCQQTATVHPPNFCDRRVSQATIHICKEVKTVHFWRMNRHEFNP